MLRLLIVGFLASLILRAAPAGPPPVPREFRAMWIATVGNIDWPSKPGLPVTRQQAELRALLDTAQRWHLNAVILQIRTSCDALYASPLEPWSEYLSGRMGVAPSPSWDPLAFAVTEAHARGLELHAWLNPFRARYSQAISPVSAQHVSRTRPDLVVQYGKFLWLDPGLAFGTGNHETTRLCVERLVVCAEEHGTGGRVIDAGCGSGILALSAALLGYRDVLGFDNDPEAVRVSGENAALNGLTGQVRFETADLETGLAGRQADLLLANIQADVLLRYAAVLIGAVAPGGTLILSGILAGENGQVRAGFERAAPGWSVNARVMGEWSDVVLVRPV